MAPETISFMPNGDITLLLTRHVYKEIDPAPPSPIPAQAIFDEDKLIEEALGIEPDALDAEKEDESFLFFAPDVPGSNDGPMYPPAPRGRRGTWESEQRERSTSPPAGFWARLKRQSEVLEDPVADAEVKSAPNPTNGKEEQLKGETKEKVLVSSHDVHCIVSSRHLILASQFFQFLLTEDSTFATALRLGQHVNISLPAVDLETMVILLNIVHGLSRKVPRQVSLGELSQLAVLARKFGMQDTVQFFSDTWIDAAQREGLPEVYEENAKNIWWFIYVFWAFDRESEFREMTKLVQMKCGNNVEKDVQDVPVPKTIIDTISRDREFAIETALTVIHTLITRYMDGNTICDAISDDDIKYACDAMVLGSLIKGSKKIGFWPRPVSPFEGKRFQDVAVEVRGIKILDVCGKGRRVNFRRNCHGLEDEIGKSMRDIEMGLDGLEVADYKMDNGSFEEAWQLLGPFPQTAVLDKEEETREESPILIDEKKADAPKVNPTIRPTDLEIPNPEPTPGPTEKYSDGPSSIGVSKIPAKSSRSFPNEKPINSLAEQRKLSEEKLTSNPAPRFSVDESRVLPQVKPAVPQKSIPIREQSPIKPSFSQQIGDIERPLEVQESSVLPQNLRQRKDVPVRSRQNGNLADNRGRSFENQPVIVQVPDDLNSEISTGRSSIAAPIEALRRVPQEEPGQHQPINNAERVKSPTRNTAVIVPEQNLREVQHEDSRNARDLSLRQRIQSPQPPQQIVNRLRGDHIEVQQRSRHSSPVSESPMLESRILERERTLNHQFSRDFQDGGARISPRNSGERVSRKDWDPKSFSANSSTHHQEIRPISNGISKINKEPISPTINERVATEARREPRNGETRTFPTESPSQETRASTNGDRSISVPIIPTPQNGHHTAKHIAIPSYVEASDEQSATYLGHYQEELRAAPKEPSIILSSTNSNHSLKSNSRNQTAGDTKIYSHGSKDFQTNIPTEVTLRNKSQSPFREGNGYEKGNSLSMTTIPLPQSDVEVEEVNEIMSRRIEDDINNAKDPITAGISITTDGEEAWAPPQNFKMRKNKKKFSSRF